MSKIIGNDFYIDTDFISSFLRIDEKNLLLSVFKDKNLYISRNVYEEIKSFKGRPKLEDKVNVLIGNSDITLLDEMDIGSKEFERFIIITAPEDPKMKGVGDGEASAIAYAVERNGIVCSNNLSDIQAWCDKYNVSYITSIDVLCAAYEGHLRTEEELNHTWMNMKNHQKLPYNSFSEFLNNKAH